MGRGRGGGERVVDLHGMDREAARLRLRDAFEGCRRDGVRRLRVVHG